jgi:hypothetical protein
MTSLLAKRGFELLPDPRNGEEEMRARGHQVVLDLAEVGAEKRLARNADPDEIREDLFGDVAQRQVADVAKRVELGEL